MIPFISTNKERVSLPTRVMLFSIVLLTITSCKSKIEVKTHKNLTAKEILGNKNYPAICYGGYRHESKDVQPSVADIMEDMTILHALGIRIIRTYNVHFPHAENVLKAIRKLKDDDPNFEMYVMLGAWIDCENAWTDGVKDREKESPRNETEIEKAVKLAAEYQDIVKILAVGNEAMVHWAESYYVHPKIILKWVNHLQSLKQKGLLPKDLWITSSDNFASWGGGDESYKLPELIELIKTVDYVSMHTYPMHDTHYNPSFWWQGEKRSFDNIADVDSAMHRAVNYAKSQYEAVVDYVHAIDHSKPVHIGETGWASSSDGFYGETGSLACDEYKQSIYYTSIREWTDAAGISCFYFEAFDENWKDAANPLGSENHFGLFDIEGNAKYTLWEQVDEGILNTKGRGDKAHVSKTLDGDITKLKNNILLGNRVPHLVE